MEVNKNVLDRWFELREEELESKLSNEDKKHLYFFDEHKEQILSCVDSKRKIFAEKEWDRLQKDVLSSLAYFNRKYYMAGFRDVLGIMLKL